MRFDKAMIVLPAAGTVDDLLGYATALLSPGAQVQLLTDTASPEGTPAARPPDGAARSAAVRDGLTLLGIDVIDRLDGPQIVILPDTAPYDAVAAVLASDRPVALLACPMPPVRALALVAWNDPRRARPAASLLRAHPSDIPVHLISIRGVQTPGVLTDVLGLPGTVASHGLGAGHLDARERLTTFLQATPIDLLVLTASPGLLLRPLLEVTRELAPGRLLTPGDDPMVEFARRLELFATVAHGGRLVVNAVSIDMVGRAWVAEDGRYAAVADGRTLGGVHLVRGQFEVPSGDHTAIGLATDRDRPTDTLEAATSVLPCEGPPIVLVAAGVTAAEVTALRGAGPGHAGRRVWALATAPCSPSVIRGLTGVDAVLHAGAVMADGGPTDLPAAALPLLFTRAVRQLRALGFPVVGSVSPDDAGGHRTVDLGPPLAPGGLDRLLAERCEAHATTLTALAWHTGNHDARDRLVRLIGQAQRRVHLQTFILDPDQIGQLVSTALQAAAARGVEIRLLVDSLWSGHGSFTLENPVLVELMAVRGVHVQVYRPVAEMTDLKQRNHRKMILVDGQTAVLTGRNLSHSYYTGFDELDLTPDTPQDLVPWVDLSAEFGGPAVAQLELLFERAWREAGGADYPASPPNPPGDLPCWIIAHRSMEDTFTLDAMRVLFDQARERITLINTFPLQHELQHVLLERLRAGVQVRVLTGNVRPRFRGGEAPFPSSPERDLMTELVLGRLDPLVLAGADVYTVGVPGQPGWDPALGRVMPHVHAKWVSVDGRLAAMGSANVDISSAYWESEVMLVVRDHARVGEVEAWIDTLLATSVRTDRDDPEWKRRVSYRSWISHNWPSILS